MITEFPPTITALAKATGYPVEALDLGYRLHTVTELIASGAGAGAQQLIFNIPAELHAIVVELAGVMSMWNVEVFDEWTDDDTPPRQFETVVLTPPRRH